MAPIMSEGGQRRIAIVGGGVSGIASMWNLRDTDYLVDMYEADARLGGHANSVTFKGNGREADVDTAFIAINEQKYPLFNGFLRRLNVATVDTDMSFGVSAKDRAFEWGSKSVMTFVGSFVNIFKPHFWRLLFDFLRFCYFASDILVDDVAGDSLTRDYKRNLGEAQELEPIGPYLQRRGYSQDFLRLVLMPMVAAVWSTDPDEFASRFPAKPLIYSLLEHRMLDTAWSSLKWKAFKNGSKMYVKAFEESLPSSHRIFLDSGVQEVSRSETGVSIRLRDGIVHEYDHVVLAVHANQALDMLGTGATTLEREILGCFRTSRNTCYLHSDTSLLPKRPSAQMAYNCTLSSGADYRTRTGENNSKETVSPISLTFDMNKIQRIPLPGEHGSPGRVLVTMNPIRAPQSPQSVHIYYHPLIDSNTIVAAKNLHKINGVAGISFAGAWMSWGFHEDGFAAGAHAANLIIHGRENVEPWRPFAIMQDPQRDFGILDRVVMWVISLIQERFLQRNGPSYLF